MRLGRRLFVFAWASAAALAEPPRGVELFGTAGVVRGGGDEGSAGSGGIYGGAVTIPFAARWAVDVQALTARLSDRPEFRERRILFSPGVQYRRGNERALWFIAFGPGLQREHTQGSFEIVDGAGGSRRVQVESTEYGKTLHWRSGGVFQVSSRVVVRGEFFWVNRYVLPSVGGAVSVGVRLGR